MATPRLGESPPLRLAEFSFKHSKADSPTCQVGESATPRLSPSQRVTDSPTWRVGESFFDYEYLREFEAKIGTAQKVVYEIYEEPISAKKKPENPPHCHVPLQAIFILKILGTKQTSQQKWRRIREISLLRSQCTVSLKFFLFRLSLHTASNRLRVW
jgi:hypothetical protein